MHKIEEASRRKVGKTTGINNGKIYSNSTRYQNLKNRNSTVNRNFDIYRSHSMRRTRHDTELSYISHVTSNYSRSGLSHGNSCTSINTDQTETATITTAQTKVTSKKSSSQSNIPAVAPKSLPVRPKNSHAQTQKISTKRRDLQSSGENDEDNSSTISNLTSISQKQKFYPANQDIVRFKLPNSKNFYSPHGEKISNSTPTGTEDDDLTPIDDGGMGHHFSGYQNHVDEANSTLISSVTNINSELEGLSYSNRKEIYECLTGMERLVNCAQIALKGDEQKSSSKTDTFSTKSRLESMRNQINQAKHEINAYEIEKQQQEEEEAEHEKKIQSSKPILLVKSSISQEDLEEVPNYVPGRKYNVSICASAASVFSEVTDAWFSCDEFSSDPEEHFSETHSMRLEMSPMAEKSTQFVPFVAAGQSDKNETESDHNSVTLEEKISHETHVSAKKSEIHEQATSLELPDSDLRISTDPLHLYNSLMPEVRTIKYRKDRHVATKCQTLDEYLVKTEIIRKAFDKLFNNFSDMSQKLSTFMIKTGRYILTGVLKSDKKDTVDLILAYDNLLNFVTANSGTGDSGESILQEISHRKVRYFNFYDILMDYILLDAFDDLNNQPSVVTSVLKNRWLADSIKESSLTNIVWTVIQTKKKNVKIEKGFLFHYYSLWEHVSPVLAWGFLGPNKSNNLSQLCQHLRVELLSLVDDLYSFEKMNYASLENYINSSFLRESKGEIL